jgi:hypothetical protein
MKQWWDDDQWKKKEVRRKPYFSTILSIIKLTRNHPEFNPRLSTFKTEMRGYKTDL